MDLLGSMNPVVPVLLFGIAIMLLVILHDQWQQRRRIRQFVTVEQPLRHALEAARRNGCNAVFIAPKYIVGMRSHP